MMILIVFTVMGCSNSAIETEVHSTENPDAKEILTINPEADIFQFEGVIYQTGIEWVDALTLTKGEKVGEIKKEIKQVLISKTKWQTNYQLVWKSIQLMNKKGPFY